MPTTANTQLDSGDGGRCRRHAWDPEGLRGNLCDALARDSEAAGRLSHADLTVRFVVGDSGRGVTLLLDRPTPAVADADEPAEVEITIPAELLDALATGQLPMPAAVVSGVVSATGPVRRYLEVDAILRRLLADPGAQNFANVVQKRLTSLLPAEPAPDHLLAIETRDLHKSFGRNQVLRGVDLRVPEGIVSVILGPSGTGKSVMLQHIIGSLRAERGDVLIRGDSLSGMSRSELMRLRTNIGVMYQDGALFSAMSVYDNVAFPLRQHTNLKPAEVREVVMKHLDSVGLASASKRMPNELSGGMKKRAGLARALALDPAIVLCDEPDSGLDPVRTALLGELLADRHSETGGTMLVITHNIELAKRIGEHISVLWQGRILEDGLAEQVLASETAFVRQFLAGSPSGPLSMDA